MDDEQAPFYFLWLLLNDLAFARQYGPNVELDDYPSGPLRGLAALAVDQAQRFRHPTSQDALIHALAGGWGPPENYGTEAEEMAEVYDLVQEEYDVPDSARGRVVEAAAEWFKRRKVGKLLDEGVEALKQGSASDAAYAVSQIRHVEGEEEDLDLQEHIGEALGPIGDGAVPTGFGRIDRAWKSGVRPGELGVVLAVTSVGKSMCLCHFASLAYRQDLRVMYYTFELAPKQVLRRIAAAVLRRPASKVTISQAGNLLREQRERRGLEHGYIKVRGGEKSVEAVRLDLEELARIGQQPDVVLLDSADDLTPKGKYNTLYMTQGEIYQDLRRLTIDKNVVVWTSTQATREAIGKAKINLRHVGDSFQKARRAHFVLGLTQAEGQENDWDGPFMTILVLKDSQHGSVGVTTEVKPRFGPGTEGEGYALFDDKEEDEL